MSRKFFRTILTTTACTAALIQGISNTPVQASSGAAQTVAAHLEAGEFQSALAIAHAVTETEARNSLLAQIAQAQLAQGELSATSATLKQLPLGEARVSIDSQRVSRESLNGLAAGLEQLVTLIMNNSGPRESWEDMGGQGTIDMYESGVRVDPNGLLTQLTRVEENKRLQELGFRARKADLNADMAANSQLRMVSLTRLEEAVADRLSQGLPVVESMKNLAGIYQIQHVFVYPETGEVVIAGPASAWQYTSQGQAVSTQNQSPTLQLDDLVTVLRTFSNTGEGVFGCSIDPRQDGLRDLKEYVEASQQKGSLSPNAVRSWTNQLQRKLGLQDVQVFGVPANSRVARVIVEADYRMKLIGIGKLDGSKQVPSYFELMTAAQAADTSSLDALRWWLSLKCDAVLKSEDSRAFEIQNSAVLCQSENQFVSAQGERLPTGKAEETNRQFAANFTDHFKQLADKDPVFADLQNVFDLALVAALINKEGLAETAGWDYGVFANHGAYHPSFYEAANTVDTVVNHRVYNGTNVVVQVAGGVKVETGSLVSDLKISPELNDVAKTAKADNLPTGRWWWDASK